MRELLRPAHEFPLHLAVYERCYGSNASTRLDGPAWLPTRDEIRRANVMTFARELGLGDYLSLYGWSVEHRERYWQQAIEPLGIRLRQPYARIVDAADPTRPQWLPGSKLNMIDSCFQAEPGAAAIVEWVGDGNPPRIWTYDDLGRLTARVANGLAPAGVAPGDAVGLVMPMTPHSVATYLGVIAAGGVVVSVADSFSAEEIALRLRLGGVKRVFTQDFVEWGDKRLPLYKKVVAAAAAVGATVVVASATGERKPTALRPGDAHFESFLASDERLTSVTRDPQDAINVLFSSGTTGEPKAIPWTTPRRSSARADAHFSPGPASRRRRCWPTNLGWMMGPWLIFASF